MSELCDNPTTSPWPAAPPAVYKTEKVFLTGGFVCAASYGIIIHLFLQCMSALLNPVNRARGGIKLLVAHSVAMFLIVTAITVIYLNAQNVSYTRTRSCGPYSPFEQEINFLYSGPGYAFRFLFPLNQSLADGLLLYRCYIIYGKNYWVITFPFLMYLASFGMGFLFGFSLRVLAEEVSRWPSYPTDFGASYFSVSFTLNILLTLMIIARLVLHSRNIRSATRAQTGAGGGVYKAIITMFVESSALNAAGFLPVIGLWVVDSSAINTFFPIIAGTQVIASFLIILRVAKRRALTNDAIVSGSLKSIRFKSHGRSTSGDTTHPTTSTDAEQAAGELGVGTEDTITETPLQQGETGVAEDLRAGAPSTTEDPDLQGHVP